MLTRYVVLFSDIVRSKAALLSADMMCEVVNVIEDLFVIQLQLKMAQKRFEELKANFCTPEFELSEAGEEVSRLTDEYNRLKRLTKH